MMIVRLLLVLSLPFSSVFLHTILVNLTLARRFALFRLLLLAFNRCAFAAPDVIESEQAINVLPIRLSVGKSVRLPTPPSSFFSVEFYYNIVLCHQCHHYRRKCDNQYRGSQLPRAVALYTYVYCSCISWEQGRSGWRTAELTAVSAANAAS